MKTIKEQSLEMLMQAELAGRITGAERRAAQDWFTESAAYENSYAKAREGWMERETSAREIIKKAQST